MHQGIKEIRCKIVYSPKTEMTHTAYLKVYHKYSTIIKKKLDTRLMG